ncbi:rRNA maturation RNase YbeY [Candidatus Kaiserbacteria bacterium RIFCSPLOWO2_02_FULL_45_11b]|uniref:Endoribonuclease YbeY n=1 Tax=Candidatus Kaiserbacteria bacterium RIFCSPLOWO2_12_FULL_45_26 TaxID=1798525 RepID=A0A1F6FG92_9BACT|nr:MAG: rRNA maturation RNase YbeY [Candidatus Kaiserbacteria bacterium RIFCSPHIGHO2_12_45_16]OGG70940.1 MAG: rRNA maturation RNase YbeY [Candidatus Kaiserbacteria bacterium RIFCSPLOWO2_01_FULL_45_25]OGG84271.1 MAG: rRNA maturation RNase YbeY [Candidatus Kaiserbacteria bacterium RIFCSPLOWO2_02_FULL_45_11b]OGG84876.1 MAG: rRNA maturation RNase YbeY [Candidatus Kaiserbacteria bacterium RIFCSPLOWO2_12_FULL_45_26]
MSDNTFSLSSTIAHYPTFPYREMKDAILGKKYELSVAFVGTARAQKLNVAYRQKTYVPNVLSFPLDDAHGEIYLCPEIAYPEAKDFNLTKDGYIAFLFIHGLLHLKGHDHGATMEALEQRYMKRFNIA